MKTIFVEPETDKNAYNCDTRRWIIGVTEVEKTTSIIKMLKKGELKLVKPPKAEKPKT